MDIQFNSKLQTAIQKLGRQGEFQPPKSQDPIDAVLHEYFVSETARSAFDKRKKDALTKLKSFDNTGRIARAVDDARKGSSGSVALFDTEHYSSSLTTKSPSNSLDSTVLKNELSKLGVDTDVINKAFAKALSPNKPAETYTVVVKHT